MTRMTALDEVCSEPEAHEDVMYLFGSITAETLARIRAEVTLDVCKRGHPWTPENTRKLADQRICRTCRSAWDRAYRERKRGAA